MATTNEALLDEAIRHAIALQQFGNASVRKILALLNRAGANIGEELLRALGRLPPEAFTVERLEALLESVKQLNKAAYAAMAEALGQDVRDVSVFELDHQRQLFESSIPPQVLIEFPLGRVNPEQVFAATMSRPFQGRLLREWAASQEAAAMQRIRDEVRKGYVEQATIQQIVSRVRGTKAAQFADGVMAASRREAEAVVRTAISHTAGFARDAFFNANDDLIKARQWVSTLDTRTREPCILRDGKEYTNDPVPKPIGHEYPWAGGPGRLHWQCRSTSVPILKSLRELGVDLDEFGSSARASMDGSVPSHTTYAAWLKRQSADRQDDVLGPVRGKLLRSGEFTVEQFANDKGVWYTIDQLRKQDAAAFKKLGL